MPNLPIYLIYLLRRVEVDVLPRAFPKTMYTVSGGLWFYISSFVTLNFLSARGVPTGLSPIWNPEG